MFECPIADTIGLEDIVMLNRLLVGCGASIAEINSIRKHFSRVKGGRLAMAAGNRKKVTLLISDVPDSELDSLGSGPSIADTSNVSDCLSVLCRHELSEKLPDAFKECIGAGLEETPCAEETCFENTTSVVLLSNSTFLEQMSDVLLRLGFNVHIDCSCDEWKYSDAAEYLLAKMESRRAYIKKGCILSGGELSVTLPTETGIGGRNQQFALNCAQQLETPGVTVLSAGTDGIDGTSAAAGAVVDYSTKSRGEALGLTIEQHLDRFDANTYFARIGDAVVTGPTGNNLRDVRLLIWDEDTDPRRVPTLGFPIEND